MTLLLFRWTAFKRDGSVWDAGIAWAENRQGAEQIGHMTARHTEDGDRTTIKISPVLYPASPFGQVTT